MQVRVCGVRLWVLLIRLDGLVRELYSFSDHADNASGFIEGVREKSSPNLMSDWDVFMLNRRLDAIKKG